MTNVSEMSPVNPAAMDWPRLAQLARIGTVTAGTVHDVNNCLNRVLWLAEMWQLNGKITTSDLARVQGIVAHGAAICKTALGFAAGERPERRVMAIEDPIDEALRLTASIRPANIEVLTKYKSAPFRVLGSMTPLCQVLVNVLENCYEAMPDGGGVTIETLHTPSHRRRGDLVVRVSDAGRGIPKETVPRVTEPLFTTKVSDGGVHGLGLPLCKFLVEAHSGELIVSSIQGVGTTIEIRLPAISAEDPPDNGVRAGECAGGSTSTPRANRGSMNDGQ